MTVPGNLSSPLLATAAEAAAAGAVATRSLRFNSEDSGYLSKTFSSAGNRDTWTWAAWIKIADFDTSDISNFYFGAGASNEFYICQRSSQEIHIRQVTGGSEVISLITDQEFRDVAGWGHLVVAVDTGQATSSNRIKVYWNGSQITSFSTSTYPSQNLDTHISNNVAHYIGKRPNGTLYLDAYLADVYFIDGSQLDPTSFGAYDDNGVWQAAEYSGTFGTNGFHLKFDDASSNAALGTDSSGNDNDFTVNNLVASAPATAKGGFDIVTYTGTGSSQSLSLSFQPDLIWCKTRSNSVDHKLVDSVRGLTKVQEPNNARVDATDSNGITATSSTGFTVGSSGDFNTSGRTYVAWCWKAGGTASSNSDGTITSSVSASTEYGFSCVSYTGNGTSGATIGHGLSSVPKWMLVKRTDSTTFWEVFHTSTGNTKVLYLNNTDTQTTSSASWNNTSPTSSVFSVGNSSGTNASGNTYIAFLWSERPGFSSFGSYEGDGDGTGPDVTTGFKPRFVIIKGIDEAAGWRIYDSDRGTSAVLRTNLSNGEFTTGDPIVFLSDGFRLTGTANEETNKSGRTYIYAAFSGEPPGDLVDSLFDSPVNGDTSSESGAGGEVSGNYVTMNRLDSNIGSNLTNGNLDAAGSSNWSAGHARGTIGLTSGKWYWEVTRTGGSGATAQIGFANKAASLTETYATLPANSWTFFFNNGTEILRPSGGGTGYFSGSAMGVDDTVGIALDMDNKTAVFYKNGTAGASIDLSATSTSSTDNIDELFPWVGVYNSNVTFNGGQRPFAFSAPTNHKPLCTALLPTPTVPDGSDYFETVLWTGDGTNNRKITTPFGPDFVWAKFRNENFSHGLYDTVRGDDKRLVSNSSDAEGTVSLGMESDGFVVEGSSSFNDNNDSFVAWVWEAASSTVSNTDGSVTTSVRANSSAGFSIVKFTVPSGSDLKSYGHGLNAEPSIIFTKRTDGSGNWQVFTNATGSNQVLTLNSTAAASSASSSNYATSSSTFSLKNGHYTDTGWEVIAYCISPVAGYSAVGSYVGNGSSSDGPFVFTGMRPRWIMIKKTSGTGDWEIFDTSRDIDNIAHNVLLANDSAAEINLSSRELDILSNGFKIRSTASNVNTSSGTYIYAAFAENPFQANGGLAR